MTVRKGPRRQARVAKVSLACRKEAPRSGAKRHSRSPSLETEGKSGSGSLRTFPAPAKGEEENDSNSYNNSRDVCQLQDRQLCLAAGFHWAEEQRYLGGGRGGKRGEVRRR